METNYFSIDEKQEYKGKIVCFDPDSSPAAWCHYKRVYKWSLGQWFDIDHPQCFSYVRGYYADVLLSNKNRLIALPTGYKPFKKDRTGTNTYYAVQRLGGETDFNFKDSKKYSKNKYGRFRALLEKSFSGEDLLTAIQLLNDCKIQYHTVLNFSLMPVMGKLQYFKGQDEFDRFDRFIFFLYEFYQKDYQKECYTKCNCTIFQYLNEITLHQNNKKALLKYLNSFGQKACSDEAFLDYCHKVYFIRDINLIHDLVKSGAKPAIVDGKDVVDYMKLALRYWDCKEKAFAEQQP